MDDNQTTSTAKNPIVATLEKINNTLTGNEKRNEKVLEENEKLRDRILEKQTEIHERQLRILFVSAIFFILFILTSAIYFRILVKELRQAQKERTEETSHKERARQTNEIFMDMWKWYYDAISKDTTFHKFAKNRFYKYGDTATDKYLTAILKADSTVKSKDSIDLLKRDRLVQEYCELVKKDSAAIMKNQNVNRFYNYFEILKTYDKAGLIDFQTAENQLQFFSKIGFEFNYIGIIRLNAHHLVCGSNNDTKCKECNCGLLLDGYKYIFDKFLHTNIPPTRTQCDQSED